KICEISSGSPYRTAFFTFTEILRTKQFVPGRQICLKSINSCFVFQYRQSVGFWKGNHCQLIHLRTDSAAILPERLGQCCCVLCWIKLVKYRHKLLRKSFLRGKCDLVRRVETCFHQCLCNFCLGVDAKQALKCL